MTTGVRGTTKDFYKLLKGDFLSDTDSTGKVTRAGYIYWMVSILILGAVGYIQGLEKLSKGFLVLVVVVLFLGNQKNETGFFEKFNKQVFANTSTGAPKK